MRKPKKRYRKSQNNEGPNQNPQTDYKIVAIIPTKSRLLQLERAVTNVAMQTRQPDELIVVGDEETDLPPNKKNLESKFNKTKVHWLLNCRTQNLSGAINIATQFLISEKTDPTKTYLALLDDDDLWETEYLQTNYEQASQNWKRPYHIWPNSP